MSSLFSQRCPRLSKLPVTARGDVLLPRTEQKAREGSRVAAARRALLVKSPPAFMPSYLGWDVGQLGRVSTSFYSKCMSPSPWGLGTGFLAVGGCCPPFPRGKPGFWCSVSGSSHDFYRAVCVGVELCKCRGFGRIWGAVMSFFPSQLCLWDMQGEGGVEDWRLAGYLQSAAEGCTEHLALCCC